MYGILRMLCYTLVFIPYLMLWILSVNKIAFKLTLKSFEFWFKITYCLIYSLLDGIWSRNYRINHNRFGGMRYMECIVIMNNIFGGIFFLLCTFCISSFDALNVSKKWKVLLSAVMALICLMFSTYYQWFVADEDDIILFTFSFKSMMASNMRNVSLFFIKQCIFSWLRQERSVIIKYNPIIKWMKTETLEPPAMRSMNTHSTDVDDIEMIKTLPYRSKPDDTK